MRYAANRTLNDTEEFLSYCVLFLFYLHIDSLGRFGYDLSAFTGKPPTAWYRCLGSFQGGVLTWITSYIRIAYWHFTSTLFVLTR